MTKLKEYEIRPSTLETIDLAFFTWLSDQKIHATTNKGWKQTPVVWLGAERNFHIKNDKDLRDSKGVLKLPIISVDRVSATKDPVDKGGYYAAVPETQRDGYRRVRRSTVAVSQRIQQRKTGDYANSDANKLFAATDDVKSQRSYQVRNRPNKKIVYETVSIPLPVYINVNYAVTVKTDYQQQMNEILAPFMVAPNSPALNSFVISADDHAYEAFMQADFSQKTNAGSLGESEKSYETTITFKVQGYIIGADKNQETPKVVIEEGVAEIKISRERVIVGDVTVFSADDDDFREF